MPIFLGQAVSNALGVAEVDISHPNSNVIWEVSQISVGTNKASTAAGCTIQHNGVIVCPTNAMSIQSNGGMGAAAAGEPYLYIAASEIIQVICTGLAVGDLMTVRGQYQEYPTWDARIAGVFSAGNW